MTQRQRAYRGVHLIARTVDVDVCTKTSRIDEERNGENQLQGGGWARYLSQIVLHIHPKVSDRWL